jgi:hypothetical protein
MSKDMQKAVEATQKEIRKAFDNPKKATARLKATESA